MATAAARKRARRSQSEGSILDSVREEANRVANSLGARRQGQAGRVSRLRARDRAAHPERRIAAGRHRAAGAADRHPAAFDAHTKLMFDLQALAFQADITRVFSMIMSRELSTMTFADIGVPEQHHAVSHHRNDPQLIAKKATIDLYQSQLFAYFLEKLQSTPDGDGSLLDHSLLLYGGGMGDGNLHRHADLPTCWPAASAARSRPAATSATRWTRRWRTCC